MNIALIIFRLGPSHGSILQTYALAETLKRLGHKVKIIDRQATVSMLEVTKRGIYLLKSKICRTYKGPTFFWGTRPAAIMRNLEPFIKTYLHDCITVHNEDELTWHIENKGYNAFVVGSDQTWRPKYVSNIYYYFLSFLGDKKVKRIAYAPSFGSDKWEYSPEQEKRCKELVKKFDAVSVREKEALSLCKEHFEIDAQWVLDPTMLLTINDYEKLIPSHKPNIHTLAYSILDNSRSKLDIVNTIANLKKLSPYRINAKDENVNAALKDRVCPSIQFWLSGIRDSSFVVADSFHATVFAIIFNKPFVAIANKERGLSRFCSLLESYNLGERLVFDVKDITEELLNTDINWDYVNKKMCEYRNNSLDYLNGNLQ